MSQNVFNPKVTNPGCAQAADGHYGSSQTGRRHVWSFRTKGAEGDLLRLLQKCGKEGSAGGIQVRMALPKFLFVQQQIRILNSRQNFPGKFEPHDWCKPEF